MEVFENKIKRRKTSKLEELLLGEMKRRDKESIERKKYPSCIENAEDDFVIENRVSVLSQPNKVEAIIPDWSSDDSELEKLGLYKKEDGWHVPNEWMPDALSEDSVIVYYDGLRDIGFCSKDEFQELYAHTDKYDEENTIEYINLDEVKKGEIMHGTKAATGRVVLLKEGTKVKTNEGDIISRSNDIFLINEEKNSIYPMDFEKFLSKYMADPTNPASKKTLSLLQNFEEEKIDKNPQESSELFKKLLDEFINIDRDRNIAKEYINNNDIETLRDDYRHALKLSNILDTELGQEINSLNFDERVKQARTVLKKIREDDISDAVKSIKTSFVMSKLLPKTNSHQHLKGSVSEDVVLGLAKKHNFSEVDIKKIKDTYEKAKSGFDDLNEFNNAYATIGGAIRTPSDYKTAINGIIEDSVRHGQLTVEIRSSVIGQRDEEGNSLDPRLATENILDAIDESNDQLGDNFLATGFTFLGYRGRDWHPEEVIEHARLAIEFATKYPNRKFSFDIAGPEDTGYSPNHFKEGYSLILEYNKKIKSGELKGETIGITTHAGETPTYDNNENKNGKDAVKEAIELGVDRIGHGAQMDKETMQFIVKLKEMVKGGRDITVEVPPTCNIDTISKTTEGKEKHPASMFIKEGVPITIATDNDAISGTNITKEYFRFMTSGHGQFMNWNNLKDVALNGVKSSFISEKDKIEAVKEFKRRVRIIEKLIIE